MNSIRLTVLGAGFLLVLTAVQGEESRLDSMVAAADAQAGRQAFALCAACHSAEAGAPARIGPNLWDVYGRAIASSEGFAYSPALQGLEGEWTTRRLDEYLADPAGVAPGTRMVIPGIKDEGQRAALIAYLQTLSDSPPNRGGNGARGGTGTAAASSAPDPFGSGWPEGPGRNETGYACIVCHSLAIVKQQGLSRANWDELLDWMVKEQGMKPLVGTDRDVVLEYLATHFNENRKR